MTRDDLVKQAYAYGASLALQEMGYNKYAADQTAVEFTLQQMTKVAAPPFLTQDKATRKEMSGALGLKGKAEPSLQALMEEAGMGPRGSVADPTLWQQAGLKGEALLKYLSEMPGWAKGLGIAGGGLGLLGGGAALHHALSD